MRFSVKTLALCSVVVFVLGLLLGYIPERLKLSGAEQEKVAMGQQTQTLQSTLHQTQSSLRLNELAVDSAVVYAQAEKNNYSLASTSASRFFTGVRSYVDQTDDAAVKNDLQQVLGVRDTTISGLATANPAVKQQLQDIFFKMQSIRPKTD